LDELITEACPHIHSVTLISDISISSIPAEILAYLCIYNWSLCFKITQRVSLLIVKVTYANLWHTDLRTISTCLKHHGSKRKKWVNIINLIKNVTANRLPKQIKKHSLNWTVNTILKSLNIQKLHMKHLRAKTASNRWKTNSYYKEISELTEKRSLQLSFTWTLHWSVTTDTLKCSCSALSEK